MMIMDWGCFCWSHYFSMSGRGNGCRVCGRPVLGPGQPGGFTNPQVRGLFRAIGQGWIAAPSAACVDHGAGRFRWSG
ncbi:hypothetical protein Ae717Ps2_5817 [Pseudonocardia sp. Ae717_Ps2]|nr:hypothetical protein Ae717Ps2_5817 [Pseudonocardia sp. Ae717_Ps2]